MVSGGRQSRGRHDRRCTQARYGRSTLSATHFARHVPMSRGTSLTRERTSLVRGMRGGSLSHIVVRMTAPIRILTADDHHLIRAGVSSFLATEPGLEVVAEATNGEEALERYREVRPDVVLMDLSMPVMDGLTATRAILEEFPTARIVVLTTYAGDEDIHRALDAGAMGYLVKDMLAAEVLKVIRSVMAGRRGIPPAVAAKLAEHTPRIALTPRETEVMSLMATGLTNAQIAQR